MTRTKTKKTVLTVSELAASGRFHCSDRTIRRLIISGKLKAANIGAGTRPIYLVTAAEVDRFLKRNK